MKSQVVIVKTNNRKEGVARAMELLDAGKAVLAAQGKNILIKPNFNTADPYPGSTHNNTLSTIIRKLIEAAPASITVGDRSGPTNTQAAMEDKGIPALCNGLGAELLNFETMPDDRWELIQPASSHWRKGFYFARPVLEADFVVNTCCLKTHGFGGVFTISLKNTIGMLHQRNMTELHTSLLSMRKMIAEANVPYSPDLIVVDAMRAMVDKGPMKGPTKHAGIILASADRIAVDAVGVALLKVLGSKSAIMDKPVFRQEQIARATALALGVGGPEYIELVTADAESSAMAGKIREMLN